jgi:hypothetical protein
LVNKPLNGLGIYGTTGDTRFTYRHDSLLGETCLLAHSVDVLRERLVSEVWSASFGDRRARQRVVLLMELMFEIGGNRLESNEEFEDVSGAQAF